MVLVDKFEKDGKVKAALYQASATKFMVAWDDGVREWQYGAKEAQEYFDTQKLLYSVHG